MNIYESAEDYLERIYMIKAEKGYVKSVDLAKSLNVSKPSVSFAMKQLSENGYITMNESKYIELTEKGKEIADRIYARHKLLSDILIKLGVNKETAIMDACRLEHHVSDETFNALQKLNEYVK